MWLNSLLNCATFEGKVSNISFCLITEVSYLKWVAIIFFSLSYPWDLTHKSFLTQVSFKRYILSYYKYFKCLLNRESILLASRKHCKNWLWGCLESFVLFCFCNVIIYFNVLCPGVHEQCMGYKNRAYIFQVSLKYPFLFFPL